MMRALTYSFSPCYKAFWVKPWSSYSRASWQSNYSCKGRLFAVRQPFKVKKIRYSLKSEEMCFYLQRLYLNFDSMWKMISLRNKNNGLSCKSNSFNVFAQKVGMPQKLTNDHDATCVFTDPLAGHFIRYICSTAQYCKYVISQLFCSNSMHLGIYTG